MLGTGTLGAFVLLLLIEDDREAGLDGLPLVEPWSGDSYTWYRLDATECVSAHIEMDTELAATNLARALGRDGRTVHHTGQSVDLSRCA